MAFNWHTINKKRLTIALSMLLLCILVAFLFVDQPVNDVPETTTTVVKQGTIESMPTESPEPAAEEKENGKWYTFHAKSGDTLSHIFIRAGLSQQTLQQLLHKNSHARRLAAIRPKQTIKFFIKNNQLEELTFPISSTQYISSVYKDGRYKTTLESYDITTQQEYLTATVDRSLYLTARKMNIPNSLMKQMTDIFSWQMDFSKEVRPGQQFSMLYETLFVDDKPVGVGQILAVTYTTKNKQYVAIRHKNANGQYDYFNEEGVSLRKAFNRYPVKFSHISSTFNLRRKHPILKEVRPHKGIDLAAPIGTPIRATGDGKVQFIGRNAGYGNMIKINHRNTYTTIYAHLLRFQKGLSRGDTVTRGQVIGYVGQSGLATGPHCHYEFHIHRQPRNPATVELPRATPIPQKSLAAFSEHAKSVLAQLKLYEDTVLAQADMLKADMSKT